MSTRLQEPRRTPRLVACVRSIACFFAALLLGCALTRSLAPLQLQSGIFRQKLEHLGAHPADYDVLFLGSSRVFRQINPATFDRTAAAHGVNVRSFNFGMDGMFAPEDLFTCEQIFKLRPQCKWVFVEVSTFQPLTTLAAQSPSQRLINWHDWERTLSVCRSKFGPRKAAKGWSKRLKDWRKRWAEFCEAWPDLSYHFRFYWLRLANRGSGGTFLRRALFANPKPEPGWDERSVQEAAGFAPTNEPPLPEHIAAFVKEFAERKRTPARPLPLPPEAQRNLERILAVIRKGGAEPVLIQSPVPSAIAWQPTPSAVAPLIDFMDLRRYPALYRVENRQDHGHLNAAGAEIYSRLLAEEWKEILSRKER